MSYILRDGVDRFTLAAGKGLCVTPISPGSTAQVALAETYSGVTLSPVTVTSSVTLGPFSSSVTLLVSANGTVDVDYVIPALQSLVSGDGLSWAAIQAIGAANAPGMIIPCRDFQTKPLFRSDGTYWRPLNGYASLWRRMSPAASPLATLTGSGAAQSFTLPDSTVFPAGMLVPGITRVWAMAKMRRLGNSGAATNGLIRLGSGASAGINDNSFASGSLSATVNLDYVADGFADIISNTSFSITGYVSRNGTAFASSFTDRTTNFDCSGSNTSLISIGVLSSFTVDQMALLGYEIGIYG